MTKGCEDEADDRLLHLFGCGQFIHCFRPVSFSSPLATCNESTSSSSSNNSSNISRLLLRIPAPFSRLEKISAAKEESAVTSTVAAMTDPRSIVDPEDFDRVSLFQPHHYAYSKVTCSSWNDIEDQLAVLLDNHPAAMDLLKGLHDDQGVHRVVVLKSLARLSRKDDDDDEGNATRDYCFAICVVADYLAEQREQSDIQLACLRFLLTLRSPPEASWQWNDSILEDTLLFLTQSTDDNTHDVVCANHSEEVFLWELRAIYQHECRRRNEPAFVIQEGADRTAGYISNGASYVSSRLDQTTKIVTDGIDVTGEMLKMVLEPEPEPLLDPKSGALATECTGACKRATDTCREATKRAIMSIREVAGRGLETAAQTFHESELGAKLVPDPAGRTFLAGVGQVGMTSLGATVIVAEAVAESTKKVYQKTAEVTANVVEYKYGSSAGQVVRDSSHTVGNVVRTVTNVKTFTKGNVKLVKSMTKSVVKDTGKKELKRHQTTSIPESSTAPEQSESANAFGLRLPPLPTILKLKGDQPINLICDETEAPKESCTKRVAVTSNVFPPLTSEHLNSNERQDTNETQLLPIDTSIFCRPPLRQKADDEMTQETASESSIGSLMTKFEDNASAGMRSQGTIETTIVNNESTLKQEESKSDSLSSQTADTEVNVKWKHVTLDVSQELPPSQPEKI